MYIFRNIVKNETFPYIVLCLIPTYDMLWISR